MSKIPSHKGYAGEYYHGKDLLTVCGGVGKSASYNCLPPGSPLWGKPKVTRGMK
jgi:hypothetical protein